jgi:hypothetical protein
VKKYYDQCICGYKGDSYNQLVAHLNSHLSPMHPYVYDVPLGCVREATLEEKKSWYVSLDMNETSTDRSIAEPVGKRGDVMTLTVTVSVTSAPVTVTVSCVPIVEHGSHDD